MKSLNVLIVDDDQDDALLTQLYVEKGVKETALMIDNAPSFSEAISSLEKNSYGIVLIDFHLGESNGLELMQGIRKRNIMVPIIFLTGQGDEEIAVSSMKEGASDYILKRNLSPDLIGQSIHYALELHRTKEGRKKVEEELRKSEHKYRAIINTTAEGFWLFDTDLNTIDLNKSLANILGWSRKEILNKKVFEFIKEEYQAAFKKKIESIFTTENNKFEAVFTSKDGQNVHAILNTTTFMGENKNSGKVSAFLSDISMMKHTERTLIKANDELKRLDQLKSEFTFTVSHELRTPLTSIKNAVDLLSSGRAGPFNTDQKSFLNMAARNIDRLADLVNDILDLSKLQSGKMSVESSEISLETVTSNVIATFTPQAEKSSIKLELDCPQNIPPVYADPKRIEQILCNLMSNALKFTPEKGLILLSIQKDDEMVEVSVTDSGIGIPMEEQENVFSRFYQVGSSLNKTTQGTGLGLSISKELVEMLGGSISVESEPGKGSCFSFKLPISSPGALEMESFEKIIRPYRNHPPFSLLVVQLNNKNDQEETPKKEMNHIAYIFRKCLRGASDLTIRQPGYGRFITLLIGTPKAGAVAVKKRVESMISQNPLKIDGVALEAPEVLGPVTYPEDGPTGRELINKAMQMRTEGLNTR
jgi:PAS domain S-box-containing protein